MGISGEDKFVGENRNGEQMDYNSANLPSDWPFNGLNNLTNASMTPMDHPSCTSTSMVDSFWDHHATNSPHLGPFCDMASSSSFGFRRTNLLAPLRHQDMFLPPAAAAGSAMLPQIPADSGFIERATRLSCFGGGGFVSMMNPFGDVSDPYSSRANGGEGSKDVSMSVDSDGSQLKDERRSGSLVRSIDGAELREGGGDVGQKECSNEGFGSKKRRKSGQLHDSEYDQGNTTPQAPKNDNEVQPKGDNSNSVTNKSSGKQGKSGSQASDTHKEEYIHVRARRGQATNSHSLAERVRREKISERMKFLQDLVPGCSKVTGKAVMLDEIINYVQSLQKQVEFLSMKLATVNPRMDFNIETLLSKDIHQTQAGPSGTLGFGPDTTMPYPPPLRPLQSGNMLSGVGCSSDVGHRTIHSHWTAVSGGYKTPSAQVSNAWNDELHDIVRMGPTQNLGSTPPDHSKAKP